MCTEWEFVANSISHPFGRWLMCPNCDANTTVFRNATSDVVENSDGATAVRSTTEGGDFILHFRAQDTGFGGDESGRLIGETSNGIPLIRSDSVKIVA